MSHITNISNIDSNISNFSNTDSFFTKKIKVKLFDIKGKAHNTDIPFANICVASGKNGEAKAIAENLASLFKNHGKVRLIEGREFLKLSPHKRYQSNTANIIYVDLTRLQPKIFVNVLDYVSVKIVSNIPELNWNPEYSGHVKTSRKSFLIIKDLTSNFIETKKLLASLGAGYFLLFLSDRGLIRKFKTN